MNGLKKNSDLDMVCGNRNTAVSAINRFNPSIDWMRPPAFQTISLGGSGANFEVTGLQQSLFKYFGRQNFDRNLRYTLNFVAIEGHSYRDRW
jgi:hypothetical protein